MIPVVVGVEYISDGLVRRLPDFGKNLADGPRGVRIDHHYVVPKDHPARVGGLAAITVALPGEDSRRKLAYSSRRVLRLLSQGHE
jgi:hypothetical protein